MPSYNKSEEIEYQRRSSQMVQMYGPGAMVDFKQQTLMTAAPSTWGDRIYRIYDRRLQKKLGVKYFGLPINKSEAGEVKGLSYVRFPEWYYCKKCHRLQSLSDWVNEYQNSNNGMALRYRETDPYMVNHLKCFNSLRKPDNTKYHEKPTDLICSRFVMVCNCGHIDDFPWEEYVHKKAYMNKNGSLNGYSFDSANQHELSMELLRSSGPEGIKIKCSCGATATMHGVLKEKSLKVLGIKCTGRHPWKNNNTRQDCDGTARAVLRGASFVYYPVSYSSILIPNDAEENYRKIVESNKYSIFEAHVNERIQQQQNNSNNNSIRIAEIDAELIEKNKLLDDEKTNLNNLNQVPPDVRALLTSNIQSAEEKIIKISKEIESLMNEKESLASGNNQNTAAMPDISDLLTQYSTEIGTECAIPANEVEDILRYTVDNSTTQIDSDDFAYKEFEYKALSGETIIQDKKYFYRVPDSKNPFAEYQMNGISNFVKNVSLLKKLREVQALLGFSRIQPMVYSDKAIQDAEDDSTSSDKTKIILVKDFARKWYPGSEVIGEGVFVEFDYDKIADWTDNPIVASRINEINLRYSRTKNAENSPRNITPGFVLVHTIAHLLLNQMSFECGYNVASLKERIYYDDRNKRSAILIYTANGDSEGSLGGLVRQGMSDVFPGLLRKALDSAKFCSNDPVCSCSNGQGRESLNLAACHSCVLLPETCCEEFNVFLDRDLLVGSIDSKEDFGFISYCKQFEENIVIRKEKAELKTKQPGSSMYAYSYEEIWDEIFSGDEGFSENLKDNIYKKLTEFNKKEKPLKGQEITIGKDQMSYYCDLLWEESKIIYFSACNKDKLDKIISRNVDTGWTFYCGADDNLDIQELLNSLIEV